MGEFELDSRPVGLEVASGPIFPSSTKEGTGQDAFPLAFSVELYSFLESDNFEWVPRRREASIPTSLELGRRRGLKNGTEALKEERTS